MIKVYRINTGSCGGCDTAIDDAVAASADMTWASDPLEADALLLTGPLTAGARPAFLAIWRELNGRVPLLAIGRCAIDGQPFGSGGLAQVPEASARLKLDGCPVTPEAVRGAIREALGR